jgi:phage gp16-like protein
MQVGERGREGWKVKGREGWKVKGREGWKVKGRGVDRMEGERRRQRSYSHLIVEAKLLNRHAY